MAGITDTSSTGITNSLQAYFSKQLLHQITQNLVLDQFAKRQALPEKAGKNSVRFFRYVEPNTTDIKSLTEGDGHTAGTAWAKGAYKELTLEYVDVSLAQVGQVIGISDLLTAQELFNHLEQATTVNGQDAALQLDSKISYTLGDDTSITGGTTITTNKISRFAGAAGYYNGADPTSSQVMSGLELLDTATALKVNNAPTTSGYYTAVADPRVLRDLQNDSDWISSRHYGDPDAIFKGEVGKYAGIRCIESTNSYVTAQGNATKRVTYDSAGAVYSTFVFGDQAYGVVDLASQSPYGPKMQIAQGPDKTDPLAQLTTIGFKTYYGQAILQPKFLAQVYSGTNYS
jgi:N4-gp56 family major capsid protein